MAMFFDESSLPAVCFSFFFPPLFLVKTLYIYSLLKQVMFFLPRGPQVWERPRLSSRLAKFSLWPRVHVNLLSLEFFPTNGEDSPRQSLSSPVATETDHFLQLWLVWILSQQSSGHSTCTHFLLLHTRALCIPHPGVPLPFWRILFQLVPETLQHSILALFLPATSLLKLYCFWQLLHLFCGLGVCYFY